MPSFPIRPDATRIHTGLKFALDLVPIPSNSNTPIQRELVVHPGAVLILPILEDGRIVLIRNHRYSIQKSLLELPAGTLEPPEDPAACAGRELIEETGYQAARLVKLCAFYTTPGFCTEFMHAYLATGLTEVGQKLEDYEQIQTEPVTPAQALAMIRDGRIIDAKTILLILHHHTFGAGN